MKVVLLFRPPIFFLLIAQLIYISCTGKKSPLRKFPLYYLRRSTKNNYGVERKCK